MFVLEELKRIADKIDAFDEKLTNLRVEVAQKGALWGAISGLVVVLVGLVIGR